MGLRINTNLSALHAASQMRATSRQLNHALNSLSSGSRITEAGDDAAGFAISEFLRGQIASIKASRNNSEYAESFIQVAEGGLNEQNNILIRLRELAIQAASDTISDNEREYIQTEFGQLVQETDRIAKTTQFGSTKLLDGTSKTYDFQVGPFKSPDNVIRYESNTDTTSEGLGISSLSVTDADSALDSLDTIDEALGNIAKARSEFGAMQSRFQSVTSNASVQIENLEQARSVIRDTDYAQAVSELTRARMQQEAQVAVLAQANQIPQTVLKLIG